MIFVVHLSHFRFTSFLEISTFLLTLIFSIGSIGSSVCLNASYTHHFWCPLDRCAVGNFSNSPLIYEAIQNKSPLPAAAVGVRSGAVGGVLRAIGRVACLRCLILRVG